jgi:beta-N-acetylhexosaminidase
MIGQAIVGRFAGSSPSDSFLARIRAGQLGGVILFADNLGGGKTSTRVLTELLQRAAAEGGNPPLLIMTDQEGGEVKRLTWAPPWRAPSEMASSSIARAEGEAAGRALRSVGINVDLAPVADVERVTGSFLHTRSFGSNPTLVASHACQFAEGLASEDVAFTLKHFPGLGRALTSTDSRSTTVGAAASALRADYTPYRECGTSQAALVMVSSAIYPNLTGSASPAVVSSEIYDQELPFATGGAPVTISDDLQAAALAGEVAPAKRAVEAGLDLALYAQDEAGSASAFERLLEVAEAGGISRARLEQANRSVLGLKEILAGATAGSASSSAASEDGPAPEIGAPETIQPAGKPGG